MVDAADLKSAGDEPYGFESRPEHQIDSRLTLRLGGFFY